MHYFSIAKVQNNFQTYETESTISLKEVKKIPITAQDE